MQTQATSSVIAWHAGAMPACPPPRPAPGNPLSLVRTAGVLRSLASLPGREADAHPASRNDWQPQGVAERHSGPILVVDDDPAILATVREILELEGYPVVAVSDGAAALRRAEEARPSLLLLDMRMPGVTGWDVAQQLRERGIAVPILVMTAAQDARLWAQQIGAAGVLPKPFDLDDLLAAVERHRPTR